MKISIHDIESLHFPKVNGFNKSKVQIVAVHLPAIPFNLFYNTKCFWWQQPGLVLRKENNTLEQLVLERATE